MQESAPHVSWILSGELPRLLVYIDYSSLVQYFSLRLIACFGLGLSCCAFQTVYAPWGEGPGGLIPPGVVSSQDDLLCQVAHHMVELQITMRYIPEFCQGIEVCSALLCVRCFLCLAYFDLISLQAFVALVVSIEIIP